MNGKGNAERERKEGDMSGESKGFKSKGRVDEGAAWVKKKGKSMYGHEIACTCDENGLEHSISHNPADQHDVGHLIDMVMKGYRGYGQGSRGCLCGQVI